MYYNYKTYILFLYETVTYIIYEMSTDKKILKWIDDVVQKFGINIETSNKRESYLTRALEEDGDGV